MKYIGCLLLFFIFCSLGIYASIQLDKRVRQLKSLERAVLSMKREIDYRLSPISDTLLHTAERIEHPWSTFFEEAGKCFRDGTDGLCCPDEIFQKELRKMQFYHPWEKDLNVISRLGKNIGELDKKMQMMQLTATEEEIKKLLQEALEEKRIKGKLYQTLGMCMGILSVILVI